MKTRILSAVAIIAFLFAGLSVSVAQDKKTQKEPVKVEQKMIKKDKVSKLDTLKVKSHHKKNLKKKHTAKKDKTTSGK